MEVPHANHHFIIQCFKDVENGPETETLDIYGFPLDYIDSYLTPALLIRYKSLMDLAEKSVKNDSTYLNRVLRARLPVDFAYLDIALNSGSEKITYLHKNENGYEIRQDMLDYLDRFVKISEQTGAARINERNLRTKAYKEYTLKKLKRAIIKNLAKGRKISICTPYSNKYPIDGVKALTDGLLGDFDFHHNWIGFEAEDMLLIVDFQEDVIISTIGMNFLKAVNSWVFQPEKITIEVSKDGKNYSKISALKGDNSDRNYLIKSIPYIIKFDPVETRYLKIYAKSMKLCPDWHRGFGNPAWIFIDELIVE